MVVEDSTSKHKVFWDEVESVGKSDKHGEKPEERAGKKPALGPGMVDPEKAHKALDRPERGKGAWAHNRFKNGNTPSVWR